MDARGNLSFLQEGNQVPFAVRRVYWIYDVPGGEVRGSHAFRNTEEIVLALSGSFEVVLHDGEAERVYPLKRSYVGLYVPQMLWRTLRDFSTNSVALILASTPYDENDYVRDFDEFHQLRNGR
ncbi:WxcM-like domain-containing protein [Limnoglobus roseus]|uniref:WxcM-like domain-containing protein n=1 Tax=Limnoglobus roseus TaxID=2598579 RepID=A0A5C1AJK6_9BACT|nr:WxcM-like domain-containing protein [Limnoglobus roseus]